MKTPDVNPQLRIAMIGAGGFAGAHLKHLVARPDVTLAAIVSRSGKSFPQLQQRFGRDAAETWSTDLSPVLADHAIDAAIICTPHDQHATVTEQVLQAGAHALVEKPFCATTAEAEPLVALAQDNQCQLMVGQCERFDPQIEALHAAIVAGDLGQVHTGRIDVMMGADTFLPTDHWYRDGAHGGGILSSVAVHRLDVMRYLLGPVQRVWAHQRTVSPHFINGADDTVMAVIELVSGATVELFASWSAPRVPYIEGLMLFGSTGAAHAIPSTPQQFGAVQIARCPPDQPLDFTAQLSGFEPVLAANGDQQVIDSADTIERQLDHFLACCRNGSEPRSSGRDNLGTLATIDAIRASAASGQWVEVSHG